MEYRSAEVRLSRMILLHDYTHHIQKKLFIDVSQWKNRRKIPIFKTLIYQTRQSSICHFNIKTNYT